MPISTLLTIWRGKNTPQFLGIFFVSVAIIGAHAQIMASSPYKESQGILGGIVSAASLSWPADESPAFIVSSPVAGGGPKGSPDIESGSYLVHAGSLGGSIVDVGFARADILGTGGLIPYRVKRGDTLSGIARDFGISVQTIIDANPQVRARALQVGQDLQILPVSGIAYTVGSGEALESIASLFNLQVSQIKEFNRSIDFNMLTQGTVIVIPGARNLAVSRSSKSVLPDMKGYFTQPAQGFNWGRLHERNAVDIANACGTPVVAAAEGLVTDLAEGWNGGYGNFVVIEHPRSGVITRYAHLDEISVAPGDYVQQGATIGTIGNTGNVHGPTGCHLHFEVGGAQNPFIK